MSKHTPGPWHWDSDPIKGDPLGRVRYQVTRVGKTIAQTYYSSQDENAEADTRLIAAAPDLLRALQMMTAAYVELVNSGDAGRWNPETDAEVIASRAAIAKATGEAA
jgi:hypothetical protein